MAVQSAKRRLIGPNRRDFGADHHSALAQRLPKRSCSGSGSSVQPRLGPLTDNVIYIHLILHRENRRVIPEDPLASAWRRDGYFGLDPPALDGTR